MRVFITGGCKNGKSTHAERIAVRQRQPDGQLYYIATMVPADAEDEARILRHQNQRAGLGFTTLETRNGIDRLTENLDMSASFLLDSVTALFGNEYFSIPDALDYQAADRVANQLCQLASKAQNIVLVSDYIYSDAFLYDDLTDSFQRGLAFIDRSLAAVCDVVLEVCFGSVIVHKQPHQLDNSVFDLPEFRSAVCY